MVKPISKWEAKEHYEFFVSLPKGIGNKMFTLFKFDGQEIFTGQYNVVSNLVKSIESEEYQKYDNERISIIRKYAKKDSFGRVLSVDGEIEVEPKDLETVKSEMFNLTETFKEAIVEYDKNFNEIWELTNSEKVDLDIPKIKLKDIPDELSEQELMYIYKHFLNRE